MKKYEIEDMETFFVEGKHRNGGCYGFTTTFEEVEPDKFKVIYSSTAEFKLCPCCGKFIFGKHDCDGYEYITEEEVKRRIAEAEKEDNEFVFDSEVPIIELDEDDVIEEA